MRFGSLQVWYAVAGPPGLHFVRGGCQWLKPKFKAPFADTPALALGRTSSNRVSSCSRESRNEREQVSFTTFRNSRFSSYPRGVTGLPVRFKCPHRSSLQILGLLVASLPEIRQKKRHRRVGRPGAGMGVGMCVGPSKAHNRRLSTCRSQKLFKKTSTIEFIEGLFCFAFFWFTLHIQRCCCSCLS